MMDDGMSVITGSTGISMANNPGLWVEKVSIFLRPSSLRSPETFTLPMPAERNK